MVREKSPRNPGARGIKVSGVDEGSEPFVHRGDFGDPEIDEVEIHPVPVVRNEGELELFRARGIDRGGLNHEGNGGDARVLEGREGPEV